ncbi:glycosyltransferase family 39 protein [Microbacterium sp. VKM Ac-2870]|nr:glycosyltransferase family 39 protein [Microbacterium sp. VKM Ac-2870]
MDTPALSRWWREPWGARITLALILVASAVLTVWNLARGGDFAFYEASARSMSQSWRALLFGAFDPAATVTLDKLSGFAVPQALSVRLFGMSTSALALPQVVEGLVTVWACALIGLRWLGRTGGLVAAAAAASTPIFVSMFAHPMEDGLLTMALAVAVLWWQRAMLTARWWPLLVAGAFVGVGFQAKMLQAWFVLPALLVGTFVAAGGSWARRAGRAAILLASSVAASLSWMLAMQLVPAASRPFVDGSTDNDVFAMVFGYNGIDRLFPNAVAGAVHSGGGGTSSGGSSDAALKLLDPMYLTQIGWLYPAALFAIGLGLWRWWRPAAQRDTDAQGAASTGAHRAMFSVAVIWLITGAGVLSAARMPHTAYLSAIGVQLALLSALAASEAVRLRASERAVERAVLPVLVIAQGGWALALAWWGHLPLPLALPLAVVILIGVVAALWGSRARTMRGGRTGVRAALVAAGVVAIVAGPALFSAQVLDSSRDGSGGDAYVGIKPVAGAPSATRALSVSAPQVWGGSPGITPPLIELLGAVRAAGGGADGRPLFLTDAWSVAAPIINSTGQEVLTDGGYSGQAAVFTADQARTEIADGVHLVVVKDHAPKTDPVWIAVRASTCSTLRSWPSTTGGASSSSSSHTHDAASGSAVGFTLYSCS